jgi:hypothetical protein
MNAVTNFFVYCGEGGWSVDDVNRLSDSLSVQRIWNTHDGIKLADLFVVTNIDKSMFERHCRVIEYDSDLFEGFWSYMNCFRAAKRQLHGDNKAIILNAPTVGRDLISIPSMESIPEQGKTENAAKSIPAEDKILILENDLYPVQQFDNWWNEETDMSPFYIGVASSTAGFIFNKFEDDYEQIIEDYDATPYGAQQWFECELESKFFYLTHAHGVNIPYAPNDWEKQEQRNILWEENVRPHFNPPLDGYGWRGLGGDEESALFHEEHEYRDISRQASWITFEGDTDTLIEDEYLRWWVL